MMIGELAKEVGVSTDTVRFYERSGWSDAGPVDYESQTAAGIVIVPCRRYEKRLS